MLRHTFMTPQGRPAGWAPCGWLQLSVTLSPLRTARKSCTGRAKREDEGITPPGMPHQAGTVQNTAAQNINFMRAFSIMSKEMRAKRPQYCHTA